MASPLSATKKASTSEITAAKSSITQKGSGNYKSNSVSSFFSSLVSDVKMGFTGPEARNYGAGYEYKTPREKRYDAARKVEADQLRNREGDNKPRAAPVRYSPPPPPIKSIEDYYNMLKQPVAPLPSLLTKKSPNYSKPTYGDVSTSSARREGGEVRSFFQSTSTGYV